jgi:hypothetical protein
MTLMTTTLETKTQRGGEWLLQSTDAASVFTPERATEEHRLIGRTTAEFVQQEVVPVMDRLEQKDWNLARDLVKRAGALGLLGVALSRKGLLHLPQTILILHR